MITTRSRRALAVVAVVVALVLLGSVPAARAAQAAPAGGTGRVDVGAGGGAVTVEGERGAPGGSTAGAGGAPGSPGRAAGASGGASGAAGPVVVVRNVLACAANDPGLAARDLQCRAAQAACPAPELLFRRYTSTGGGPWTYDGSRCLTAAEAAQPEGAERVFPGFGVEDLRRLPLPPSTVVLEPGNGYALVGVPLNVAAGGAAVVLDADVAGFDVRVRAVPVAWTWDFGDGERLGPTSDPGAPFPAGTTGHTYTAPGAVAVVLTTTYAGEFSVDGGPSTPVVGTAEVGSPPVVVDVLTGRGGLVADARHAGG